MHKLKLTKACWDIPFGTLQSAYRGLWVEISRNGYSSSSLLCLLNDEHREKTLDLVFEKGTTAKFYSEGVLRNTAIHLTGYYIIDE